MVTIRKHRAANGIYYEIDDFSGYVQALRDRGIERQQYDIGSSFPPEIEQEMRQSAVDFESQVKIFFKLSPATGIDCEVVEA